MIPPVTRAEWASPGERDIFTRLQRDVDTEGWYVLHSLDVAEHVKQVSGEVDFVIIVPSKGVLCLEVKGCSRLRRENGVWYYGTNRTGDPRGPFKQAAAAMHSLRKKVAARAPALTAVPFWSAAAFPFLRFPYRPVEWHPWQVVDEQDVSSIPMGEVVRRILDDARSFLAGKPNVGWFNPRSDTPSREDCQVIMKVLRGDFEFYESPKNQSRRISQEVKYFTEEQFSALDGMQTNPRVVFTGPAGTGKTLLAIECARRSSTAGYKVLLLCFNRLLGQWLNEQTTGFGERVVVGTIHSRMLAVLGASNFRPKRDPLFWNVDLPRRATEKLLREDGDDGIFDELVVDEVQDILSQPYLDFLDLSLKGGFTNGRWRIFGDFERQAVYKGENLSLDEFRKGRGADAPVFSLRKNCRNTPLIATLPRLLGRLDPDYEAVLRPDDGVLPDFRYYLDLGEQRQILVQALETLHREGFKNDQIVILSPSAKTPCAASVKVSPWADRIKPYNMGVQGAIGYCTIHAFKGLESEAVVVTDVERIAGEESQVLFYVASTRALRRIFVLARHQVKTEIRELMLAK